MTYISYILKVALFCFNPQVYTSYSKNLKSKIDLTFSKAASHCGWDCTSRTLKTTRMCVSGPAVTPADIQTGIPTTCPRRMYTIWPSVSSLTRRHWFGAQ